VLLPESGRSGTRTTLIIEKTGITEMKVFRQIMRVILATVVSIVLCGNAAARAAAGDDSAGLLDFNEQTHLVFTCEEEKLARDVYRVLGRRFPEIGAFANMQASKDHNMCAVLDLMRKYRVSVPRVNDNVGVFSWGIYGRYFAEKYMVLTSQGSSSPMDALYVGAFMEELNILDINECPKVIVDISNGINEIAACGRNYTRNPEVLQVYDNMLEESRKHLRLLVHDIEQHIGTGKYQAQILQQKEVDDILSRQQLAQP
jgi:hypothetical protein